MKINLLRNSNEVMSGYLNLDPFATGEDERQPCSLDDLSCVVEDAEAREIVARDVVDFFEPIVFDRAMSNWISKLRHGGRLVVGGVDLYEVSKALSNYSLPINEANILIHGRQQQPWDMRKSNGTMLDMAAVLESRGLKIMKKRVDNFMYIVEAVRQ